MIGTLVLGSVALSLVMERKYELRDELYPSVAVGDEKALELLEAKRKMKSRQTSRSPEQEYAAMKVRLDIDNWQNHRVPRPDGVDENADDYYLDDD
eukprot:CAMPEP_0201546498 /NCGR_PEP_ID=MMETSP0173_2-20130828/2737_1 /ASSEMBLY_ACC=CAM_ASM_000268 /TAXON_ID=218659 /ORGANISM="Vexillifera sp., Strain DIVA3 564/2" /LENGTH=95 /DNA_ID=CAMNT_0047955153 /DNA_START=75 /DNA_END=362 /DNA_ORIENTATION=-